jgi:hippurate hydrolase
MSIRPFRAGLALVLTQFLSSVGPASSLAAEAGGAGEHRALVQSYIEKRYPVLESLYRHLHTHPELSFQEEKTAARLGDELGKLGFAVTLKVGGHGLVGVLKNGPGPTLLIRTDLDGLPVKEQTGLPYSSQGRGRNDQGEEVDVMHACGHDIHMTAFVGAAELLAGARGQWSGTLVMIGQPAEERGAGARAMLKEGLFTRFPKPDYCIALHCSSTLLSGTIGTVEGYALASVDSVDVLVKGVGGHGAWPHAAKDPIVLSAEIIMALQTIVSRELPPIEPAVLTVGSIHGGTKHNIIPEEVKMQLTLRAYSDDVRNHMVAAIRRITAGLAAAAGLPEKLHPVVTVKDEFTPATYNDPELTRRLSRVLGAWVGSDKIIPQKPVMGGEDFGEFGRTDEKIPINMIWLGVVEPESFQENLRSGKPLPALHSSYFRPDPEKTIKTGVTALAAAAFELLGKRAE